MRSKNRPDGRTESFIEAARRAQIVAAAIEALNAVGYSNASLARIAQQAGISKSVISYHFAGKGELFEYVIAHVLTDCAEFMRPRLAAETTAAGRLKEHIRAELAYMETHHANFVALGELVVNHRDSDGSQAFADDPDEYLLDELLTILRDGQRDGEFRDFDPYVMAITVSQAVDGALTAWASGRIADLGAYSEELVTTFDLATARTAKRRARR
ncbi:MAG: TetR family transcriptional regulator [Streptosporangiales bacterium]|nr:TetR family transcriptional regulator [Streptosporangiales bacterium]